MRTRQLRTSILGLTLLTTALALLPLLIPSHLQAQAPAALSTTRYIVRLTDPPLALYSGGIAWALFGGVLHWAWAVFHLLVVPLQAFIFMVLTVVYLEMAHHEH